MYRIAITAVLLCLVVGIPRALSAPSPNPIEVSDAVELAAAINQANDETSHPGPNTILLNPGSYELTEPYPFANPDGPAGLPTISSVIVIDGQGQTITRSLSAPAFRLFYVDLTGDLTVQNLTITNGNNITLGTEGNARNGAGIFNLGTLTLENCTLLGNIGHNGGALRNMGVATLIQSYITGNSANFGAGIANRGTLIIQDSEISENDAGDSGGGLWNASGGIVTLDNSVVSVNTAIKDAGGIRNQGTLTVMNGSQLIGNSAGRDGGAIKNTGEDAQVDIDATSRITDNIADADRRVTEPGDSAGNGGGIWNADGGTVNSAGIIARTVCYNVLGCGGGVYTVGSGIFNNTGDVSGNSPEQIVRRRGSTLK